MANRHTPPCLQVKRCVLILCHPMALPAADRRAEAAKHTSNRTAATEIAALSFESNYGQGNLAISTPTPPQ